MRKLKTAELKRKDLETYHQSTKTQLVVVLDDVRSASNVGAVFRTADTFLLEKIILCGITGTPPNKEIHKTALGAQDAVNWEFYQNASDAVEELKNEGYTLVAIEQTDASTELQNFSVVPNGKYALILGNEVKGVSQKLIDQCAAAIEIPQLGTKHSLNVSVCAGIVIWEFCKKMGFAR